MKISHYHHRHRRRRYRHCCCCRQWHAIRTSISDITQKLYIENYMRYEESKKWVSVKKIAEVNTILAAFLWIHLRILKIFLAHSSQMPIQNGAETRERVAYAQHWTSHECWAICGRKSSIVQYNSLLHEMRRYWEREREKRTNEQTNPQNFDAKLIFKFELWHWNSHTFIRTHTRTHKCIQKWITYLV